METESLSMLAGALVGLPVGAVALLSLMWGRIGRIEKDVAHLMNRDNSQQELVTDIRITLTVLSQQLEDVKKALSISHRQSDRKRL